MIELIGRKLRKQVEAELHLTILDTALKHDVDWSFSCTHGTCARCRCLIQEGQQFLSEPNVEELDRLEPEELAQGYRLACQTTVCDINSGPIVAINKPYF